MKTAYLFFGLLAATCGVPVLAQAVPAAPIDAATARHRQAAEVLLRLTSSPESYNQSVDQKLTMMFKQFPDKPNRIETQEKMRVFLQKYLSWESILPELAKLYTRNFTEVELRDLIAFYQTPTGRKLVALLPQFSQARMNIGQRRMQEHMAEFEQLFQ